VLPHINLMQDGTEFLVFSVGENTGRKDREGQYITRWWSLSTSDKRLMDFLLRWVDKPGKPMLYTCAITDISIYVGKDDGEARLNLKARILSADFVPGSAKSESGVEVDRSNAGYSDADAPPPDVADPFADQ
jgi:hypothetical protein